MRAEAVPPDAVAAYRRAIAAAFLAKADIEVSDEVLEALPRAKAAFAVGAAEGLADEAAEVLGRAPRSVEFLPDKGTFHAVFRIESTESEVFFARTSVPTVPKPALDFAVDAWAAETLPGHGVPTPALRHLDLSRTRVPFDFEIVEAATGQPLPPGPGDEDAVRSLGALAARMHAVPCAGFGPLDPPLEGERAPTGFHASWRDYVMLRLDQHVSACRSAGALTDDEARATLSAFRRAEPILDGAPGVLLHGDLGNHNVFVRGDDVTAVLDWEDSLAGDPVFDISCWGTFVGNHERRGAFLDGYRTVSRTPPDLELRYWLYFLRIMLAKTVHRRRFGYARTDRIPAGARLRPALRALCGRLEEAC